MMQRINQGVPCSSISRCKIPALSNDTYEVQGEGHQILINHYIPWKKTDDDWSLSQCNVYTIDNETAYNEWSQPLNVSKTSCSQWVYDTSVFQSTFITKVRGWGHCSH